MEKRRRETGKAAAPQRVVMSSLCGRRVSPYLDFKRGPTDGDLSGGGLTPAEQLDAVLTAYALIQHQHHGTELPVSLLHRGEHVTRARQQLQGLVADLLAAGVEAGDIRSDITPDELAGYCLHALTAAGGLPSEDAVRCLLAVTMSGLRPQPAS